MHDGTESAPSPSATSFAGLLASLTEPKQSSPWNDDRLADDIATLSYENALRAHARYRAPDRTDRSLTQAAPADTQQVDSYELAPVEETASPFGECGSLTDKRVPAGGKTATDFEALAARLKSCPFTKQAATQSAGAVSYSAAKSRPKDSCDGPRRPSTLFERNLKTASITIRMNREESDQLHRRADEAGLTVSAYLRSCTFEAESLRALVKDTMAQLQAATQQGKRGTPTRHSLTDWLIWFFTPWRSVRRMARA